MCAALGGCSSTGGGAAPAIIAQTTSPGPSGTPAAAPPPISYDTAEFLNQPGLATINALPAYETGASGAGVVVAIIDTGIDVDNPEFEGRIHAGSADLVIVGVVDNAEIRTGGPNVQDSDNHGTPVASIIAAARDSIGVHGVAPDAQLLVFRADDNTSSNTLLGEAIVEGIERAASLGADVLNMSFGSDTATARAEYAAIFDFTKQHDIVTVISAGNDGEAEPDETALGAVDVAGQSATIVAGAAKANGEITSFSNHAGAAADIFLLAPGEFIHTTFVGAQPGDTQFFSGASAATPHIAGAAALIRELWPQLSAPEVVDILLTSATDLGAPGTDPIYGRGLLNLGAAVAPIGTVKTSSVSGVVSDVSMLGAQLSPAFGSGISGFAPIVVFDDFDRDFRTEISGAVRAAAADRFEIEAALNPFNTHAYARRRLNSQLTVDMQLTSRDRSLTDISVRSENSDDHLAVALTNDLGAGRSLTLAQGFSAALVDRMGLKLRQTRFMTPGFFEDAFLPHAPGTFTAVFRAPLAHHMTTDVLFSYADHPETMDRALQNAEAAPAHQRLATVRAGLNLELPGIRFRLEQGLRQEVGSILNATFGDNTSALTIYGAIDAQWMLSQNWRLNSRYAAGYTIAETDGLGGLVGGFSNLTSSQFSISLAHRGIFDGADSLWIGVSQPLLIQSGSINMVLPTGYDQRTETLSFSAFAAPLAAKGGRLDFEAGYALPIKGFGSVDLNLIHQTFAPVGTRGSTTLILRSGLQF